MERMVRDEAIQFLTMKRDLANDAETKDEFIKVLVDAGEGVGYTPAFRCLVKRVDPEESIRWGK